MKISVASITHLVVGYFSLKQVGIVAQTCCRDGHMFTSLNFEIDRRVAYS